MALSCGSQLELSYGGCLHGSGYSDAEIQVVLSGTVIILRRHSIHGTLCSHCANDDPNQCRVTGVDRLGFITMVQCLICGNRMPTTCRRSNKYLERIRDPSVLQRGDHVAWYRPLAHWDHAIVTGQQADRVSVIGYTVRDSDRPSAMIVEREYAHRSMSSLLRGSVYRIVHDDCYTNEYTALRAEKTVGEEKYDSFEHNSQHSSIWCKTGLHSNDQLESGFSSFGKVVLGVLLRAALLSVLWLLQICHLVDDSASAANGLSVQRGVSIAYVALIVIIFVAHAIYKNCVQMKSSLELSERQPHDDWMESCRKHCTVGFFRCCCLAKPGCSRMARYVCFVSCFFCSCFEATCSLCAEKFRNCGMLCCGRPVTAVIALVVRVLVREVIAASGAFLIVWFMDDFVSFFESRNVIVSDQPPVNRAAIVIVAIMVVSPLAYLVGVLVGRWAQGLIECCCYPCNPSHQADYRHDELVKQPCAVHDEIMHIPSPKENYHMTSINIDQTDNQCSAVILL